MRAARGSIVKRTYFRANVNAYNCRCCEINATTKSGNSSGGGSSNYHAAMSANQSQKSTAYPRIRSTRQLTNCFGQNKSNPSMDQMESADVSGAASGMTVNQFLMMPVEFHSQLMHLVTNFLYERLA
ncbi:hypothetical protein B9Z55_024877 [Caenorhabditis nigoni]|uniref:Uncharacterized protein n=1 Tax=Caenorhabditis nigoni TaxID=1611254 RepID=A0A2G5SW35_9PELO|nr:hypothetical protein B9Z55_024877 [Caenorhabditis nigoni]